MIYALNILFDNFVSARLIRYSLKSPLYKYNDLRLLKYVKLLIRCLLRVYQMI